MVEKQIKNVELSVQALSDFIESVGEENTLHFLRSFKCGKNTSIESYLHSKAVLHEKAGASKTFIVMDLVTSNIVGYFTLTTKIFVFSTASGKNRERLTGDKKASIFNALLIAKIGRDDAFKGIVEGKDILGIALDYCSQVKQICAIKIVCVEYEDIPALKVFYEEQNGFKFLQKNENGLNCSFVKI